MKFVYRLVGMGWAKIEIEVNGKEYISFPSYLSEPLIDLLEGLLSIIPGCVPEDEMKSKISFKLYQEPAVDKVTLELTDNLELRIVIEELGNEPFKNGKIVFNETCNLMDFLNEVIKSLKGLLKNYGFIGYKNNWYKQDFPISSFLKLKYYLNHEKAFPTSIELDEVKTELEKSELEEEIKLMFLE